MAKSKTISTKGYKEIVKPTIRIGKHFIREMYAIENDITEHKCQQIAEKYNHVSIVAYNDRRDKYQTEKEFYRAKHFFLYNKYAIMSYWMMRWRDKLMMAEENPDKYKFDFGIQQKIEIYRKFRDTIKKECNIDFRRIVDFSVTVVNEPFVFVMVLVEDSKKVYYEDVMEIVR